MDILPLPCSISISHFEVEFKYETKRLFLTVQFLRLVEWSVQYTSLR